jgi:hypothetical protein
MCEKGTVQIIHRSKATRSFRRSEHEYVMSMSAVLRLSTQTHFDRSPRRKDLRGRFDKNLYGILYAHEFGQSGSIAKNLIRVVTFEKFEIFAAMPESGTKQSQYFLIRTPSKYINRLVHSEWL